MKHPLSVKIDEKLWPFIKNKPNKSRYIEELIKQDIQQAQAKPIVQSVKQALLSDETFFTEIETRFGRQLQRSTVTSTVPEGGAFKSSDPSSGYPCCQKASPCKHWQFNGDEGMWVNPLTNQTREG